MSAPAASADSPRPPAAARSSVRPHDPPRQQLYVAGGLSAAMAATIGLATLATLALIGWVAAPHGGFGEDIPDVLRLAVQMWLVGHHVGFAVPGGEISLLPMGLVLVPGLVVYRMGRRLARNCDIPRVRGVFRAALAIAGPYSAITGTMALVAQTSTMQPSMIQALVSGFLLAYVAGGLGVLRQLLVDKRIARRRLLFQLPPRVRSLVVGTFTASVLLGLAGLVLFLVGLAANLGEAVEVTQQLRPGIVGGGLLVLLQALYLPNAVVFGASYAAGPGFMVGADTIVAPTGISHGPLPALPMLAAIPANGPAPLLSLAALLAPFVAGGVAGWQMMRARPTPVSEAAPLWGFVCGVCTGVVWGALAVAAGGPLGAERLASVGPSGWQVGAVVALEVGLAAAIAGWFANWLHFRRAIRSGEVALADDDGEPGSPLLSGSVAAERAVSTVAAAKRRLLGATPRSIRRAAKKARRSTKKREPDPVAKPTGTALGEEANSDSTTTTTPTPDAATGASAASTDGVTEPEPAAAPPADRGRRGVVPLKERKRGRGKLESSRDATAERAASEADDEWADDADVQFGVVYEEGATDDADSDRGDSATQATVTPLTGRLSGREGGESGE
ncbi:hypothetical protein J4H86_20140 [Spiractinospora alimapuensis]|uniref:cell division protein PerM n=1 Tax=Spiractinospora alimapuensis TaxID=2820884 RepID=UPI002ED16B2A|nr:hypothetical protein J4H86_20140 [Spiractinospora alimapuensis]